MDGVAAPVAAPLLDYLAIEAGLPARALLVISTLQSKTILKPLTAISLSSASMVYHRGSVVPPKRRRGPSGFLALNWS